MPKRRHHKENAEEWLAHISQLRGNKDIPILQSAMGLYDSKMNPLLEKGLSIANTLLALGLDNETLAAGMIYPALKAHEIHLDSVSEALGESSHKLLHDVMQMQTLGRLQHLESRNGHQIENMRKMLLAMVSDVRAVLIILAERVLLLHEAKEYDKVEQKKLAQETFDVYAPLANRLGIWQIKWEIEDLCLRYLEPDKYNEIAKGIAFRREEREEHVKHVIAIITDILKEANIQHFEITGRVKHIYSIYSKMKRKRTTLQEIYDMSALRVLVDTIEDCYTVLSILQSHWQQIPKEFDDYINNPKPNGYRSIHTVLIGPENHVIEVQIRTYQMHHESELGVAAHWRYKEGVLQTANYDAKIALLRQIMAWQHELVNPSEMKTDQQKLDLFVDRIYVFTPLGDIVDLPKDATPLDFAYHIHSEVGHRCRGAKVNGNIVPLIYHLQTGERVEVLTAKQANPSRDWMNPHLGYLNTQRARAKVAHWFRMKDSLEHHEEEKISHPVKESKKPQEEEALPPMIEMPPRPKEPLSSVQILGIDNLLTHLALCCKPLPGDAIIGYVTRNRGVSIHRRDCSNATHIGKEDHQARLIEVNWSGTSQKTYSADLRIRVSDRPGLLRDITALLSTEKIIILGLQTQKLHDSTEVDIYLTVEIANKEELKKTLLLLRKVPDVIEVMRR